MRHLRDERGFSLAELMVATAIVGVIMAGIFVLQVGGQRAYLFGSGRVETQQNARVALDLITRELRSATAITTLASATGITFVWKDEANASHTVQYALSGTTLNRTFDGVTTPLIGGVTTLAMTYYSVYDVSTGTYTQTTNAAQVKVIKVSLQTGTEEAAAAGTAGDAHALMESAVTLRSAIQ